MSNETNSGSGQNQNIEAAGLPRQVVQVQQLFIQHQHRTKAFILSLHPNVGDAEDSLQETFLTVTAKAAMFEPGSNFMAWACAIARFKLMEFWRKSAKVSPLDEATLELLVVDQPVEMFSDDAMEKLRHGLDRLPPRFRQMITLRYHHALDVDTLAKRVGWKTNAVYVAMAKARVGLHACMNEQGAVS